MRTLISALSLLLLLSVPAYAQEQPAPEPTSQPPNQPDLPPTASAQDSPEVSARFQQAMDAFAEGRYDAAEAMFREVSQVTVMPERRAMANEMARQAGERRGRAPGTPGPDTGSPAQPTRKDDQDARSRFLASTLVLGLNYGWMVPLALDVSDERAFVGTYMVTAGASFLGPYLATRNTHVTKAMSTLASSGAGLGIGHGALFYLLVNGDDGASQQGLFGTMVAASLIEGAVGYTWAQRTAMREGTANAVSGGAVFGAGFGMGVMAVALGDNLDDDLGVRGIAGTVLAGSLLGAAGGYVAADERDYAAGDVYIVETAGVVGVYLTLFPLSYTEGTDAEDVRLIVGTLLAGATAGLVIGDRLVDGIDASGGQGGLVTLGTAAGGLLGAGVGFLASPDEGDDLGRGILLASGLGAAAGFGLMYYAVDFDAAGTETAPVTVTGMSPWTNADGARGLSLSGRF